MPIIDDQALDQHKAPTGTYGYSAAKLDDLGANEFTLVTIVNDVSSSVQGYKTEMEQALKNVVEACGKSPRADNLLLRLVQFHTRVTETHGFKLLTDVDPAQYDDVLQVGGMTALFDASEASIAALGDYAKKLYDRDILVNGIVIIVTDGDDNSSSLDADGVKTVLQKVMRNESLESLVTILVGVGLEGGYVANLLDDFKNRAGLTQFIDMGDASPQNLAKLAAFVSQSISATSQALGTGGPSKSIPLTI
jgi:hypothetical protein